MLSSEHCGCQQIPFRSSPECRLWTQCPGLDSAGDRVDDFEFCIGEPVVVPHLDDVGAGRRVSVYGIDPVSYEMLNLIATATTGERGWVDLSEPIMLRAGEGFVAVPE